MTDEERAHMASWLTEGATHLYDAGEPIASVIIKSTANLILALSPTQRERRELLASMMLVPDDEQTYAEEAYHALERADAIMRLSGEGES